MRGTEPGLYIRLKDGTVDHYSGSCKTLSNFRWLAVVRGDKKLASYRKKYVVSVWIVEQGKT